MSGRSFHSVFMVASCAGAALGCYLVSLRVASERAALEDVETRIVLAQRDIRLLQTEIGTRGRLAQLERWNVKVLALSAPTADQFLDGGFALAKLARPTPQPALDAPVVLASAPAPKAEAAPLAESAEGPAGLMHRASLKLPERSSTVTLKPVTQRLEAAAKAKSSAPAAKPAVVAAKPATADGKPSAQPKKVGDKRLAAAARPVTKTARPATNDPLAPLAGAGHSKSKESGSAR